MSHRFARLFIAAALSWAALGAQPAAADCWSACQSAYDSCRQAYDERDCATTRSICQLGCSFESYGAIAYSEQTGAFGWSFEHGTQAAAEASALGYCQERQEGTEDCRVLTWFRSACGALALDPSGPYGAAWGQSEEEASRNALAVCGQYGGGACAVAQTVCSR